jgi:hypothetical protein
MTDTRQPGVCGCGCDADGSPASRRQNRPGLSALSYRIGTHATFKRALVAALADQPALRMLTTRDASDPAMAVLDAFATVGDVLTFYQERIANEGFLRTATERRSILELARAIGYELKPGVAAGTFLTFVMDDAVGAPPRTTIAAGSKVQSVPGQDEKPQLFETVEAIEARVEWNALKTKSTDLVLPHAGHVDLYLEGTATHLQAGDVLIFVGEKRRKDPSSEQWDLRRIRSVLPDLVHDRTRVVLQEAMNVRMTKDSNAEVYVLRQRAALFGHNAPDFRAMPDNVQTHFGNPGGTEWPHLTIAGVSDLAGGTADDHGLLGDYYGGVDFRTHALTRVDRSINFHWGTGGPPNVPADRFSVRWRGWLRTDKTGVHAFQTTSDDGVRLSVGGHRVIENWTLHPPTDDTGTISLEAGHHYPIVLEFFENTGNAQITLRWKPPGTGAFVVVPEGYLRHAPEIHLDGAFPKVVPQGWVALVAPNYTELYHVEHSAEDARADFTLSAKTTRLNISGENLFARFNGKLRETAVFVESERLTVAERPIADPIGGTSITLAAPVNGLEKGRPVEISGKLVSDGSDQREIALLADISLDRRTLYFGGLTYRYRPDTVTVNANVARATHGEGKFEVLGSGDATRAFQRFTLKQKPLTYVGAANARGAASTLELRVNDVLWHERDTVHGAAPEDRVFVTRRSDEGDVTVQFGDGDSGARPPSGQDNVTARYRVGIGLPGRVKAGQLSLLLTRPPGVRGVRNAQDATGAGDPEARDAARANAPLTVLALDRVVSLQDYEDYACAFAGIGKAQATWLWDGEKRFVHLTVAGVGGAEVPTNSDLYRDLVQSIDGAREPTRRVTVDTYRHVAFFIEAAVLVDRDYVRDHVHAAVTKALEDNYSFARRAFGAPVTKSDVLATVQRVAGVVAADLNRLYDETQRPALHSPLAARRAVWDNTASPPAAKPAALLVLAASGVTLTDMAP